MMSQTTLLAGTALLFQWQLQILLLAFSTERRVRYDNVPSLTPKTTIQLQYLLNLERTNQNCLAEWIYFFRLDQEGVERILGWGYERAFLESSPFGLNPRPDRRNFDAKVLLLTILYWLGHGLDIRVVAIFSGIPSSCLSDWLWWGLKLLQDVLESHSECLPSWPTADGIRSYASCIRRKYSSLVGIWGSIDGTRFEIQRSGDNDDQNRYYNREYFILIQCSNIPDMHGCIASIICLSVLPMGGFVDVLSIIMGAPTTRPF